MIIFKELMAHTWVKTLAGAMVGTIAAAVLPEANFATIMLGALLGGAVSVSY